VNDEDILVDQSGVKAEKTIANKNDSKTLNANVVHGVLDATRLYLNEIGFSPLLGAEEEVYFSHKALRGDESARKRMIESNLRLVVKIAR